MAHSRDRDQHGHSKLLHDLDFPRSPSSVDPRLQVSVSQFSQFSSQAPYSAYPSSRSSSLHEPRGAVSTDHSRLTESMSASLIDGPDNRPLILSSGHTIGNVRTTSTSNSRPTQAASALSYSTNFQRSASGSLDMSGVSDERSFDSSASLSTHHSGHLSSQPSSENLPAPLRETLARSIHRYSETGGGSRITPPIDDR